MAAELKPCPFCGGAPKLARHPGRGRGMWHEGDDVFSIDCMKCGASAANRYREELIVECWNKRGDPSADERHQEDGND